MPKLLTIMIALSLIASNPFHVHAFSESSKDRSNPNPIETRVYLRKQCLLSEPEKQTAAAAPQALGLAAIFVPLLIGKAISGVSAALKKAGAEETLRDSARLPAYLYQLSLDGADRRLSINSNLGCVILIRGRFSGPDELREYSRITEFSDRGILSGNSEDDDIKRIRRLNQNFIPVTDITAVYEAAINQSNDKTAVHYEPRFLEVRSFQGSRSSRRRALVVSLAFYGVASKDAEQVLSLSLQNLGEVERGVVLGPNQLRSKRSSWLGGLGVSESALKAIEKLKPNPGVVLGVVPATVEGTFIETDKGSKALRFIAEVLDASKEDLTKNVSGEILNRKEEAEAEADATEKLYQEEEAAYAKYLDSESALAAYPPLANGATAAQMAAHEAGVKVKNFEVERTKRLWCTKFSSLKIMGVAPPRPAICE